MTAPRSRASSTSRCCRSASRAHASCSSISPGCTRRSPRRWGRPRSAPSAGWSATTCATTRTSSTSRPTCPTRRRSGPSAWRTRCADPRTAGNVATQLARRVVNLLDLPKYGRYQHSYEQLLAAHEPLIAAASDRVTVLGLGAPLAEDSHALYLSLATSPIPLSGEDLALLGVLAEFHVGDAQPEAIAVRESRAVVNRVRLEHGLALELDTPVDVLRLACALSDGDVSLREPTRFRSLRRAERRALLSALDAVAERQAPRRQPLRRAVQAPGGAAAPARVPALRGRAGRVRGGPRGARGALARRPRRPRAGRGRRGRRRSPCWPTRPGCCCAASTAWLAPGRGRRSRTRCARPPRRSRRACCCRCASTCSTAPARRPCACSSIRGAVRG